MRYQLQTLALIIQLRVDHCYTFVSAARLGDRSRIERQRRSLRSLSQNHSFAGYHRRRREGEEHYRERLRREYGSLGDFILIEQRMGRNKRAYTAYSGAIFKIAVGEEALLTAYHTLCYLIFAPADVASGAAPFLADSDQRAKVLRLLAEHRKHLGGGADDSRASWFSRIPHGAFGVVMDWGTGRRQHLPMEGPPAWIHLALVRRVSLPRRKAAALHAAWNRLKADKTRGLSIGVSALPALIPTTLPAKRPLAAKALAKTPARYLIPSDTALSTERSRRRWAGARRLLKAGVLVLLLLPMTRTNIDEPVFEVSKACDDLRIMPLYTHLDIEVDGLKSHPIQQEQRVPDLASPEQLPIYFIPEP